MDPENKKISIEKEESRRFDITDIPLWRFIGVCFATISTVGGFILYLNCQLDSLNNDLSDKEAEFSIMEEKISKLEEKQRNLTLRECIELITQNKLDK